MKYYIDDLNGRYNFRQTGIFYEWHPIHAAFSRLFCFALWVGGVALFDRFLDFLLSHANIILTILYKKMFVLVAAVILAFLAIALYRVSGGKAKFHYFADDIALIITGKKKRAYYQYSNVSYVTFMPLCFWGRQFGFTITVAAGGKADVWQYISNDKECSEKNTPFYLLQNPPGQERNSSFF